MDTYRFFRYNCNIYEHAFGKFVDTFTRAIPVPWLLRMTEIRDEIERRHGTAIHLDYSRTAREINLNARWAGRRGSVVQYISSSMRFIQE